MRIVFLLLFNLFTCLFLENAWTEVVNNGTAQNTQEVPADSSAAIRGEWCFDSRPQKISLDATRNLSINSNSVRRESFRGNSHSQSYEYNHDKKILVLRDPQPQSTPCSKPRMRDTDSVVMTTCYPKEISAVYELQDDGRLRYIGIMLPYDPNWQQLSKTALLSKLGKLNSSELDTRFYYKLCSPLTS